jgi:hypothetical protein
MSWETVIGVAAVLGILIGILQLLQKQTEPTDRHVGSPAGTCGPDHASARATPHHAK